MEEESHLTSRVDVIIPCYKYAHFLRECIASVLVQTGVSLQILIIDDASPDNTEEVARELATQDERVEFLHHSTNQGHIATYNEGLDWTSGDYVLILSADDLLTPGALRRAVEVMNGHPEIGFTFGSSVEFFDEVPWSQVNLQDEVTAWHTRSHAQLLEYACEHGHTNIRAPTVLVRSDLQKKVGGYRAELPHSGDTEMWLRLAWHGLVGVLHADQAFQRLHRRSMSHNYPAAWRLRQQKAAFDTHFQGYGQSINNMACFQMLMQRRFGERAFWGAYNAFEEGDVAACEEYLQFAVEVYPAVRSWQSWSRLVWKRRLGSRVWSCLCPIISRLQGNVKCKRSQGACIEGTTSPRSVEADIPDILCYR